MKSYKGRYYKHKESIMTTPVEIVLDETTTDEEILRMALSAEQGAINLYLNLRKYAKSPDLKAVLDDIIDEEKVHVWEFQDVLDDIDIFEVKALRQAQQEEKYYGEI